MCETHFTLGLFTRRIIMAKTETLKPREIIVRDKIVCNRRAKLITSDWDAKARYDIVDKNGFRITEDGKNDINTAAGMFSIHSPLYGTDYQDEHAFEDRYSCDCGTYTGKNFEGKICPKCKQKVQYIDIDMSTTGWIILDRDCIMNTIYYKKIKSFIGKKIFPDIIKYKDLVDRVQTPSNPFDGIGIIEFQDRFNEIMDFYYKKHSSLAKKRAMYHFIMSHQEQVFAHAIPVYSSHLRPFVVRAEEIKYTDDDKLYRRIYTNSKMLNDRFELERRLENREKRDKKTKRHTAQYLRRENIIAAIQTDLDKLWDMSFETIKKKTGIIRDKILGGRLNFTARNVIVPDKELRPNEIGLGYTTFLELYKLEIISILTSVYTIPHSKAWSMVEDATVIFNEQIYKIMTFMIKHYKIYCEVNRNPNVKTA